MNAGIKDYYFRIGAIITPPKAPSKSSEMFAELIKAIGSLSDINHQPSIELTSYSTVSNTALLLAADPLYSTTNSGSFYIGLDLENYVNGNQKDLLFTG